MQCKDIPETPILHFLAHECKWEDGQPAWATFYDNNDGMPGSNSLSRALPDGTPIKLARAKIAQMRKKGLVDACCCGCRGDIEITDKGRAILATPQSDGAASPRIG